VNRLHWILLVLLAVAAAAGIAGWRKLSQARAETQALQAEIVVLQQESASGAAAASGQREAELATTRSQGQELLRLRNEVNQLRLTAKDAEKLRAENQQLRSEYQKHQVSGAAQASPAPARDQFPKDNWAFAGYSTPDAAMLSAIWAMKEGNPKTYLESLSPEEQARMSKAWENKSAEEIAAKHQNDVSTITGMRILDRKSISPEEAQMTVYLEGVDRMEKVSMKLINNEWKFSGFAKPKQ
jgi:hypothetical protein